MDKTVLNSVQGILRKQVFLATSLNITRAYVVKKGGGWRNGNERWVTPSTRHGIRTRYLIFLGLSFFSYQMHIGLDMKIPKFFIQELLIVDDSQCLTCSHFREKAHKGPRNSTEASYFILKTHELFHSRTYVNIITKYKDVFLIYK